MSVSLSAFYHDLMVEHLEEASYLYDTRIAWREDPELGWSDVAELEQRLEAHLDALVIGKDNVLKLYSAQLAVADAGQVFALASFSCRVKDANSLEALIVHIEPDNEAYIKALVDALSVELPKEWMEPLTAVWQKAKQENQRVLTNVIACACVWPITPQAEHLTQLVPALLPLAITKLTGDALANRLVVQASHPALVTLIMPYLRHDSASVKQIAAISVCKLGEKNIAVSLLHQGTEYALALAIIGTPEQKQRLQGLITRDNVDKYALMALGFIGNLSSVEILLGLLDHPELGQTTAQALNMILGADLREEVFVAETFEKADLFEQEMEDFEQGILPKHPSGEVYGEGMVLFSQCTEVWRKWLEGNVGRFDVDDCYRLGQKCTVIPIDLVLYRGECRIGFNSSKVFSENSNVFMTDKLNDFIFFTSFN